MISPLLQQAVVLTDDEVGGHGHRFRIFEGGVDRVLRHWLTIAASKSELLGPLVGDDVERRALAAAGEPDGVAMLYRSQPQGANRSGLVTLIRIEHVGDGPPTVNRLCSAFPFFDDGTRVEAVVRRILLHPNRLEARLDLRLSSGAVLQPYDPMFAESRKLYVADTPVCFAVTALAYQMCPAPQLEHVIDDAEGIRLLRAVQALTHGPGTVPPEDLPKAIQAWQPETDEDRAAVRISTSEMAALLPCASGPTDDMEYQGEVVRVTPRAAQVLEQSFWRVDTTVLRFGTDFILPIYVAESLFHDDWRPEVGQYVTGSLWLQAHLVDAA